jgi:PhoH-like ATPase
MHRGVTLTDLLASTSGPNGSDSLNASTTNGGVQQRTRLVLDTSVLIADPTCVLEFSDADVIVPLTVVEELDGLKSRPDDVGRAARTALRTLEELRVKHGGSLAEPVPTGNGTATLRIEINNIRRHLLIEHGLDPSVPDNRIIGAAIGQSDFGPTTMVSNDAALRIKAAHLGVSAAEHRLTRSDHERPAVGWTTIDTTYEAIDCLYAASGIAKDAVVSEHPIDLRENEFAVLRCGSQSALVRSVDDEFVLLPQAMPEAWGLRPRSKEQRFALELLLDPDISVIALDGRAGTGKTILAIAAGLEQVVEEGRYERLAVYRPLIPVGRADVGFLPGGLDEKLDPWMAAIHDAVVALTDRGSINDARNLVDELTTRGQLSLESVTFLRGRSLQRQVVVVDEAQNLEPTTLRTILTRVGAGTKVIFTGDTSQIDAPYLGESNNALSVLTSAFAGQRCFGHITLTACERSDVASLAAELL